MTIIKIIFKDIVNYKFSIKESVKYQLKSND